MHQFSDLIYVHNEYSMSYPTEYLGWAKQTLYCLLSMPLLARFDVRDLTLLHSKRCQYEQLYFSYYIHMYSHIPAIHGQPIIQPWTQTGKKKHFVWIHLTSNFFRESFLHAFKNIYVKILNFPFLLDTGMYQHLAPSKQLAFNYV